MLEPQVAFVHRFEARATRPGCRAQRNQGRCEHRSARDDPHSPSVPSRAIERKSTARKCSHALQSSPRTPWYEWRVFTGLVQATGRLRRRTPQGSGFRLDIEAPFGPLELGESISVNGACLTVTATDAQGFSADVSVETHERTTLGEVPVGQALNLERALAAGDRLGGHLVTGHVDGVARVAAVTREGGALRVVVEPPAELCRFIAEKGSITLDGVSLTVNVTSGATFEVMLIPHTLSVTNLERVEPGRKLNVEVDLLARYVVRYLEATSGTERGLEATLRRSGYLS